MGAIAMSAMAVVAPLLVAAVVGFALVARAHRAPILGRVPEWQHTMGTVLSATVQVSQNGAGRHECPLVFYAYQVNGEVFQGQRVRRTGNGLHPAKTIDRFPAGSSVVVYYDPIDPKNSALEL